VLIGFAGILIFLIALSAVPVDVRFSVQCDEGFRGSAVIAWLFGLIRLPVRSRAGKVTRDADLAQKSTKRRSRTSGRSVVAMLRSHGFVHRLIRFASEILGSIQVRALRLRGRLGLEDPADTGRVWSFVGPLTAILTGVRGTDIRIEPDFESASLSLEGNGLVRIIPIEVFVAATTFILSPATLRALWALFASRRK
jgi:hypothetical protein